MKSPGPSVNGGSGVSCNTWVNNMRELVILECTECKRRNYTTMKEKRNTPERLEKKKYCKFERKHTVHKETR